MFIPVMGYDKLMVEKLFKAAIKSDTNRHTHIHIKNTLKVVNFFFFLHSIVKVKLVHLFDFKKLGLFDLPLTYQ
jgi:hypothetical protein